MTQETITAIFHDWRPSELAALHRATAWLRAMQTDEWQIARQQMEKPNPMKGIK